MASYFWAGSSAARTASAKVRAVTRTPPILLLVSLLATSAAAQEIFRTTDEHGNVVFTDQPPAGSATGERIELQQTNTTPATPVPPKPKPKPKPQPKPKPKPQPKPQPAAETATAPGSQPAATRARAFGQVDLSSRRGCLGRIYFHVPGGIQHGQHWLNVQFEKSLVRVPFRILTEEEEKKLSKSWKDIKKEHEKAFKK